MGREAETICHHAGAGHAVKALLETDALILRGGLKRKFPLSEITALAASDAGLSFKAAGETYLLALSAPEAAAWARKITTPPPSLAQKLGLSPEKLAWVIEPIDDETLGEALKGHRAAKPEAASCVIAVLRSMEELTTLLKVQDKSALPLWLANVKGAKSPLGENAIRTTLRAAGYKDVKTCAVSASLAATRYARPAAEA